MTATPRRAMALVAMCAAVIRIPVWMFGHVIAWPDTIGYMRLADRLHHWDWAGYNAQRTPGYPLLLLAAREDPATVWVVQLALGTVIAVMVFSVTHLLTGSVKLSLLPALAYAAAPHMLVYESSILTETWCTFLTVLPILMYLRLASDPLRPAVFACAALGAVLGLGVLTRPMQALLIPLFAAALISRPWRWRDPRAYRRAAACVAAAAVITLTWCGVNRVVYGKFTLSTLSGLAMLNVTSEFIENAAPEHRPLVDIILPHREALMRASGSGANVGWLAYNDLRRVTGLDDATLSGALVRMSLSAIAATPGKWARTVAAGWAKFWFVPGGLVRDRSGSEILGMVTAIPFVLANFCFLAVVALAAVNAPLRRGFNAQPGLWLIVAIVLTASVAQAITEGTSGTRYAIPYQPLFFVVLAAAGARVVAAPGAARSSAA